MLERRQSIGEVSESTGIPQHHLRRWESSFPQLKPGRHRNGRRYYLEKDVEIIRRIHYLLHHEKLQVDGARRKLSEELKGVGRPRNKQETLAILDRMEAELRTMIDAIDMALLRTSGR